MTETQVLIKDFEQAELQSTTRPADPLPPDGVEGRTLRTLVSAGTELNIYLGHYHRMGAGFGKLPFVPGYAAVFEVEAVGGEVTDLKPGDLAYGMGPHRSWQRMERASVLPVPEGLAPEVAAHVRMMNIGLTALSTAKSPPPSRVAVAGLGPVGLLAAQIFRRCGYEVLATDPVESRRDLATTYGIGTCPSFADAPADWQGAVRLFLECAGHEDALVGGIPLLAAGGEAVLLGVPMVARTDRKMQELTNLIFRQRITVRGGSEWQIDRFPDKFHHPSNFTNMAAGLRWLADGSVRVDGAYALRSPSDIQSIYQDLLHRRAEALSLILDWT